MTRSFAILFLAFATSSVVAAADLDSRSYSKAPSAAPAVTNWTGFYVGGQIGARWSDSTWTTTALGDPIDPTENFRLSHQNPASFDSSTVRTGIYAGYNYQISPSWVTGLEGDVNWGDSKKSFGLIPGTLANDPVPGDTTNVKTSWDASIRGRLGYLLTSSTMLFGSGGVAWQQVSVNATCTSSGNWCAAAAGGNETMNKTKVGWTAGGGLETRIAANWLARVEYRYSDYGDLSNEFFVSHPGDAVHMRESLNTQAVSVGVAYQFGTRP